MQPPPRRFGTLLADSRVQRAWSIANVVALPVLALFWLHVFQNPRHLDAYSTWNAWSDGSLYPPRWEPVTEYPYGPPLAQLISPLTHVSFKLFNGLWALLQLGVLVWMLGPAGALIALVWPIPSIAGYGGLPYGGPVFGSLYNGNPEILVAGSIAFGLARWPGWFTFVLLTKVTAGIGVLWFVVRREWRQVAVLGATMAAVILPSVLVNPEAWGQWLNLLAGAAGHSSAAEVVAKEPFLPVPLIVRGPIGVAVVVLAAWRGWLWAVPIGCFLALPDIHLAGFAVLAAVPAVWWRTRDREIGPVRLLPRWPV
jgi:glycosyl transferase family 87